MDVMLPMRILRIFYVKVIDSFFYDSIPAAFFTGPWNIDNEMKWKKLLPRHNVLFFLRIRTARDALLCPVTFHLGNIVVRVYISRCMKTSF